MNKFVDRTSSRFIRSTASGVVFMRGLERPTTVTTQQPFTAAGVHAFEVVMPVKDAKTAVGFMADPPTTSYMTPTYSSMPNYISMGGAGFVYPATRAGGSRYGQGDTIRVELQLDASGQGVVRFSVNGQPAGEADWALGPAAYPAISSEGGEVECRVTWG